MLISLQSNEHVPLSESSNGIIKDHRILSVDVVRGIATLFGILSIPVVPALEQLKPTGWRDLLIQQLSHAPERGFTFLDWGYPAFLLLLGVAIVFSLRKYKTDGNLSAGLIKVLNRSAFLFVFAFFLYGGCSVSWAETTSPTVFHALALCILLSGVTELYCGVFEIITLLCFFLAGHSVILLTFAGEPGMDPFSFGGSVQYGWERSFGQWWDSRFGPHYLRGSSVYYLLIQWRQFESCLCGLLVGRFLLTDLTVIQKVVRLAVVGFIGVDVAILLNSVLPIHKMLWTPSYEILTSGMTCLLLSAIMLIADYWGIRRWTTFFVVFGRYPLVAWAVYHLVPFRKFAEILGGTMLSSWFGEYHALFLSLLEIFLWWLLFYWVYRNNLSLKWNALPRTSSV